MSKKTDSRALSSLIEQPETFKIQKRDGEEATLQIHPLQLGRLAMISKRIIDLDLVFDGIDEDDMVKQMWTVCAEKPREVAEIIAIATLKTKDELDNLLQDRTDEILWSPSMTTNAYANILHYIVFQSYYGDFMKAIRSVRMLRVNVSQETKAERIARMEAVQFGGK